VWCNYNFHDISERQEFQCYPTNPSSYKTEIILEGEVSDTIQLSIYTHGDIDHIGIRGTYFVESHKLTGIVDTVIEPGWGPGIKLFGVIEPLTNANGHLKVEVRYPVQYM